MLINIVCFTGSFCLITQLKEGALVNLALEEIQIVDISRVLAGKFCTMILGDSGAEVTKKYDPEVKTPSKE